MSEKPYFEDFRGECNRRRDAGLGIRIQFNAKGKMQQIATEVSGGYPPIWDGMNKQWLMYDQASYDAVKQYEDTYVKPIDYVPVRERQAQGVVTNQSSHPANQSNEMPPPPEPPADWADSDITEEEIPF